MFLAMIFGMSDSISSPPIGGGAQARVLNPYLVRRPRSQVIDLSKREFTMGLNSNQCVGAVKASKRYGAARKKFVQKKPNNRKNQLGGLQKFGDGKGFNPNQHCVVCRATYLGCIKPHRPHHERCHRNKATKGQSAERIRVEKTAQGNLDKNNSPPANMRLTAGPTAWEKLNTVWGKARIPSLPFDEQPTTKTSSHEGSGLKSDSVDESLSRHL